MDRSAGCEWGFPSIMRVETNHCGSTYDVARDVRCSRNQPRWSNRSATRFGFRSASNSLRWNATTVDCRFNAIYGPWSRLRRPSCSVNQVRTLILVRCKIGIEAGHDTRWTDAIPIERCCSPMQSPWANVPVTYRMRSGKAGGNCIPRSCNESVLVGCDHKTGDASIRSAQNWNVSRSVRLRKASPSYCGWCATVF